MMLRNRLLQVFLFCFIAGSSAQDLVSKIPSTADLVVTIKGKNITELVSVKEFENSKIGAMMLQELIQDSKNKITSFTDVGVNLDRNFYYFMELKDKVLFNCFLVPLDSKEPLINMFSENKKQKIRTEGNVSYIQDEYDGSVIIWNNNCFLVLITEDLDKGDYSYDDYSYAKEVRKAVEETSEIEEVEEMVEAIEIEEVESVEEIVEEVEGEVQETIASARNSEADNDYCKKEQKRLEERRVKKETHEKKIAANILEKAKAIISADYSNGTILKNKDYVKSLGKGKSEISVWVNDFGQIYKEALPDYLPGMGPNPFEMFDLDGLYGGMSLTSSLNLEKSKATISTAYTMNDEMASLNKAMYNGKVNNKFFKYVNEDKMLAYFSVNLSTEGILTEYPKMMEKIFGNVKENKMDQIVPLATDLFSILLDEKGVARILRGDMLFVVTDMAKREVTYTTYEYDDDYNRTEVVKTKEETIPDFLFMFTSEEEKLFNNLMKIGVREDEIRFVDGMYQIKMAGVASLEVFVMFKDDMVFIGSSKINMTAIQKGTFVSKISSGHKKIISKNSSSIFIDGKKTIAQIPSELYPSEFRDKIDYISDNTEGVYFTLSKVKGNTMNGEIILNTPKQGHKNSLAYFLNMMDTFME